MDAQQYLQLMCFKIDAVREYLINETHARNGSTKKTHLLQPALALAALPLAALPLAALPLAALALAALALEDSRTTTGSSTIVQYYWLWYGSSTTAMTSG
jgi:hypothetical protein